MKFENTKVMNFEGAFRGLRNPLESWGQSDSFFGIVNLNYEIPEINEVINLWVLQQEQGRPLEGPLEDDELRAAYEELWDDTWDDWIRTGVLQRDNDLAEVVCLGPKDINLAQRMIRAGSSDRKFLRQIMVCIDITAPLYWWKEFDTYKIGTVANSTSTMHKLASTPINFDCFEKDDFQKGKMFYKDDPANPDMCFWDYWRMLINDLENLRQKYNETKDKRYWKELIRLLPESWLQTRTVTLNYEVLRNMVAQRRFHRLTEWHAFCKWVEALPYAKELILYDL